MNIENAFDELQSEVNADPEAVRRARSRRDMFRRELTKETDVLETVPSGSIARGSQIEPINDVDLVIVFDGSAHPTWGESGVSAEEALRTTREYVTDRLGEGAAVEEHVRLARVTNHAVKCFLDDPDDSDAFTVDVTPALRTDDGLIIPEGDSQVWIDTDPEKLIQVVDDRNARWRRFVPLVRVLKRWNVDATAGMKSLSVEVLALDHLPEDARGQSIARFFAAAAQAVERPIADPTGHSEDIDPELDRDAARRALEQAAEVGWMAVDAAARGASDEAACHWRAVFGDIFPQPPAGCGDKPRGAPAFIPTTRPRPIRDAPQG